MRAPTAVAAALILLATPAPGAGQGRAVDPATGAGDGPRWTLDKSGPAASRPATAKAGLPKPPRAKPPRDPDAARAAERAARLAEGRRKFFEQRDDDETRPADFGGYDYRRDTGTMGPGATFKF